MSILRLVRIASGAALAFSSGHLASAPTDKPTDYSRVAEVKSVAAGAAASIVLPIDVYLNSRDRDLRDLRVFDSTGRVIPHSFLPRSDLATTKFETITTRIFPVSTPHSTLTTKPSVTLQAANDATVVTITGASGQEARSRPFAALLVDLKPDGNTTKTKSVRTTRLEFDLPSHVDSYEAKVALESSNDQRAWVPVENAHLLWLINDKKQVLRTSTVDFAPVSSKYLRIRWLSGEPIQFASIRAVRSSLDTSAKELTHIVKPEEKSFGADLVYRTPAALPAGSISLDFHGTDSVLPATVGRYVQTEAKFFRPSEPPLEMVASTTFFRGPNTGAGTESNAINVHDTRTDHWVIRPLSATPIRPSLIVRGTPDRLVFAPTGVAPYSLAFGRDGDQSKLPALGEVLPGLSTAQILATEPATLGKIVTHRSLTSLPIGASHHRSDTDAWWLWLTLAGAVSALTFMAWRLYSQINSAQQSSPKDEG